MPSAIIVPFHGRQEGARHRALMGAPAIGRVCRCRRLLHRRPAIIPYPPGACAPPQASSHRCRLGCAPQASTGPPPAAARPAALEASELRATRNIRGLRTKMIWGTMGVRHGAHTDTRAKSEQRPTHTLLTCFVIEKIESPWRIRSHIHAPPPNRVGQTPRRDDKTGTPASPYELHIRIFFGQYM